MFKIKSSVSNFFLLVLKVTPKFTFNSINKYDGVAEFFFKISSSTYLTKYNCFLFLSTILYATPNKNKFFLYEKDAIKTQLVLLALIISEKFSHCKYK